MYIKYVHNMYLKLLLLPVIILFFHYYCSSGIFDVKWQPLFLTEAAERAPREALDTPFHYIFVRLSIPPT